MKKATVILGCTCAVSFMATVVAFEIWGHQAQHAEPSATWDVLFWVGLVGAVVGAVSGCVAVGLLVASWVSQKLSARSRRSQYA